MDPDSTYEVANYIGEPLKAAIPADNARGAAMAVSGAYCGFVYGAIGAIMDEGERESYEEKTVDEMVASAGGFVISPMAYGVGAEDPAEEEGYVEGLDPEDWAALAGGAALGLTLGRITGNTAAEGFDRIKNFLEDR